MVHVAESSLGFPLSVLRGESEQFGCLDSILRYTSTREVHSAQMRLSERVSLVGGKTKPVHSLPVILGYTQSALKHSAQVGLAKRIVLGGEPPDFNKCRRIIATLERSYGERPASGKVGIQANT